MTTDYRPGPTPTDAMKKSVYDIDNNALVNGAETVNDGTNDSSAADVKATVDVAHTQGTDQALDTGGANEVSAANAADAVTKKHTQGTDQALDTGGANEVSAAQAKTGYTHSGTTGNPHSADQDDIDDGTTYARVKASELDTGQVKQVRAVTAASNVSGDDIFNSVRVQLLGPFAYDHSDTSPATIVEMPARSWLDGFYIEPTEDDAGGFDAEFGITGNTDCVCTNTQRPKSATNNDIHKIIPEDEDAMFFEAATNLLMAVNTAGTGGAGRIWLEITTLPTSQVRL